jgi:hypothetical protein
MSNGGTLDACRAVAQARLKFCLKVDHPADNHQEEFAIDD